MYQRHAAFIEPDNPETTIWRYRPYKFFWSILENKSLYFSSIKKVREKNDSDEGTFPESNKRAYHEAVKRCVEDQPEDKLEIYKATEIISKKFFHAMSEGVSSPFRVINCWNIREYEDQRMWDEYANDGVAIKTTFKNLTESFNTAQEKWRYPNGEEVPVYAGKVQYINRHEQRIPYDPVGWSLVIHKDRETFQHESELRVAAEFSPAKYNLSFSPNDWKYYPPNRVDAYPAKLIEDGAIFIPVNLNRLIETVVISPHAEPELRQKVEEALRYHEIDANVELSMLN